MIQSAAISNCGNYRYTLGRRWAEGEILHWIMLNPSTADAYKDDPTIKKCIGFARLNGFSGIEVRNLFAYRATDPMELVRMWGRIDLEGPLNEEHIRTIPEGSTVVCAWGSFVDSQPRFSTRPNVVKSMLAGRKTVCVKQTTGQPWHPLYVKYGELIPLAREAGR